MSKRTGELPNGFYQLASGEIVFLIDGGRNKQWITKSGEIKKMLLSKTFLTELPHQPNFKPFVQPDHLEIWVSVLHDFGYTYQSVSREGKIEICSLDGYPVHYKGKRVVKETAREVC